MKIQTRKFSRRFTIGTTAIEVLGPNPLRKAFALGPVAGQGAIAGILLSQSFAGGTGQSWQVPSGVTAVIDAYAWGAGGNGGDNDGVSGGGGGGGGAFASTGGIIVIPGQIWTLDVATNMGGGNSTIYDGTGVAVAVAATGVSAANGTGGTGGTASTGIQKRSGGDGGTNDAGTTGFGGGGAGGYGGNGGTTAGQTGGTGGGTAHLLTFGVGGNGGAGGLQNAGGTAGTVPGGGGGGSGEGGNGPAQGADGAAVIIYAGNVSYQTISLSTLQDVVAGAGMWNWTPGYTDNVVLCDEDVGSIIGEPWYMIAGNAGNVIEITEWIYEPGTSSPGF